MRSATSRTRTERRGARPRPRPPPPSTAPPGADRLYGTGHRDVIHATGNDRVDAGRGNDHVYVTRPDPGMVVGCAEGFDVVTFTGPHRGVQVKQNCERVRRR
ncbi:MAG: hypothetical protein ACXVEU_01100 [Nocardioidaceae bacterium]